MSDLSSKSFVVHQEDIDLLGVVDDELLQAVREEMAGLLGATVTDLKLRNCGNGDYHK